MQQLPPTRARSSQRGFVIIAVLWILIALSSLAVIFSVYLSNSSHALATTDTDLVADAVVSASLELTAYQLMLADEKSRPSEGSFRFRLDNAEARVTFMSEAARIDLNSAPKEMLANLFEVLGAEQGAARDIADRIDGWRSPPKSNAAGNSEEALYLSAGLTYGPRGGPFAHVNELSLVLGIPPGFAERVLPFVTVFNGSQDIDVLAAPPEVIAALPGMTPEVLNEFLKQRPSLPRDKQAIAAALGPANKAAALPEPRSYRVVTALRFDNGRRVSCEAVIALAESNSKGNSNGANGNGTNNATANNSAAANTNASANSNPGAGGGSPNTSRVKNVANDKEPYSILSWQDDLGTGTRSSRRAGG